MGKGEVCIGFWWRNLREDDRLEDLGVNGRIILRMILNLRTPYSFVLSFV
jgi:hypothetical protein